MIEQVHVVWSHQMGELPRIEAAFTLESDAHMFLITMKMIWSDMKQWEMQTIPVQ